ncbi:hypothetical protein PANT_10c00085 [Moesziomyces antarcticus T-34]|uniref:Uncharacterized protein n=1 Tax=Pseudozyma antarctica (strain T-34) TaxID=1151754 RepID=M9LW07_PSEA3|nr:hypothetical protein PANT_10c00085 [Moesziomyces antarcticus T-34]
MLLLLPGCFDSMDEVEPSVDSHFAGSTEPPRLVKIPKSVGFASRLPLLLSIYATRAGWQMGNLIDRHSFTRLATGVAGAPASNAAACWECASSKRGDDDLQQNFQGRPAEACARSQHTVGTAENRLGGHWLRRRLSCIALPAESAEGQAKRSTCRRTLASQASQERVAKWIDGSRRTGRRGGAVEPPGMIKHNDVEGSSSRLTCRRRREMSASVRFLLFAFAFSHGGLPTCQGASKVTMASNGPEQRPDLASGLAENERRQCRRASKAEGRMPQPSPAGSSMPLRGAERTEASRPKRSARR